MAKSIFKWALPGALLGAASLLGACGNDPAEQACAPTGGSATGAGGGSGSSSSTTSGAGGDLASPPPGQPTEGKEGNTFHHPMDPTAMGEKDPFEILKDRAAEGPPEIRTRLHSCSRIPYASLGAFLTSRGVDMNAVAAANQPPTAGQLYKSGGDSLGVAHYEVRQSEAYFYTVAGATKLFDIFIQAAPEIIANITNMDACKANGVSKPVFDAATGECVYSSLTCIMGRPPTSDDLELCNLMVKQADKTNPADVENKKRLAVAVMLTAANSCE